MTNNFDTNTQTNNLDLNKNETSIYLISNLNRTKTLISETKNYTQTMKNGEYFQKIVNGRGRTVQYLISLSQDELNLIIICNKCCRGKDIIPIENISSCEVGYSNNFYTKKRFENYFTIVLSNNKCYEFYHSGQDISKKWVNSINYLIQKRQKTIVNPADEIKLNKEEISNIWQKEIIPNWPTYRKYLHDKNKENYFIRKGNSNMKKVDKKKCSEENIEILQSNHEEILYLWTLGLPLWLRKNLWNIVIGNELEITENLFKGYIKTIFNEYINNQNIQTSNLNRISKSTYCTSLISNEDFKNNLIKDITNDIDLIYKQNEDNIKSENKTNFKEDILVVVRSFCFFRLDILYKKEITRKASFIYLNTENNYDAFRILCNLIIPSYLFDFLQNNVEKINNYCQFFELLTEKYAPFLYNYFQSINFSIRNLFSKWTKNLFLKSFNYNICLIIFDNFIIKGKIFIFQLALAILLIKQNEILNSDFSSLTLILQKSKFNIEEDILFSEIEKLDIREEYKDHFDNYALGKEKIELFQDL